MTNCQTQIANMDVLEWCKREPEVLHHAMLCDPPYHLTSIVKRFGKESSAPAQYGKDGVYSRASKGFCGQEWDGGDIAFQPETWAAFLPHLHPGAMCLAFAGTRGYHRMACAIEDAGYILQPMMVWTFSTGFPKATRVKGDSRFDGHRYGGQSLKPAFEPICTFRKCLTDCPKMGTLVDEITLLTEAFLCQFINVSGAESVLSELGEKQNAALENSVRLSATLLDCALNLPKGYDLMAMWESSGVALMALNIAMLWQTISGEVCSQVSMFTTKTEIEVTTALKIWKSWLSTHTPDYIIKAVWTLNGAKQPAPIVINPSSDSQSFLMNTPPPFAIENALQNTDDNNAKLSAKSAAKSSIHVQQDAPSVLLHALIQAKQDAKKKDAKYLASSAESFIIAIHSDLTKSIITALPPVSTTLDSSRSALEPICMFQKPFAGRPIESITATGAGTINIEKGRIGTGNESPNGGGSHSTFVYGGGNGGNVTPTAGRWPSNFLLDEESAILLDVQSGNSTSGGSMHERSIATGEIFSTYTEGRNTYRKPDSGGASRFFFQSNWQAEEHEPFRYCAKAGRTERDAGLEGFELRPKSGHIQQSEGRKMHGDTERFPCRNNHPCIKPIRLTKYLSSLLSTPPEYAPRRILVPFSGSGSEMIGCVLSGGWEFVQGIELSSEYAKIAEARIKFWKMNSGLFESLTEDEDDAPIDAQETLF